MITDDVPKAIATSLSNLSANQNQRRLVFVVGLTLLAVFAVAAPFANAPLAPLSAFPPSIQAIIFVDDLITSILLFAQYAIAPSRGILVLASGYLFTALIVVAHALVFPGAFAPLGLFGAGLQTAPWLYTFWHIGQPLAVIVYALLKDDAPEGDVAKGPAHRAIGRSVTIVIGLAIGLTWFTTAQERLLPPFYLDPVRGGIFAWSYPFLALEVVLSAIALATLWARRRSVLDYWLILVAWTFILEELLFNLFTNTRYSVGFYTGRMLLLATSVFVLALLLAETTFLSARLARLTTMLQRERDNKLMNLEALAASISHEVKQPVTAITLNGSAALQFLEKAPPDLSEVRAAIRDMIAEGLRTNQLLDNMRALFGKARLEQEPVDMNVAALRALSLLRGDLNGHNIVLRTELASELPTVVGYKAQLEEVIVNLCKNAIEAMLNVAEDRRVMKVRTEDRGGAATVVEVEDSGPGVDSDTSSRMFEPFFTTKSHGMGLGLALCRMIVERHGGQLSLVRAQPSGCVFRILLPAAAGAGASRSSE